MWEIWTLSQEYKKTPAELLFIKDEQHAFFMNRAVAAFGMTVSAELQEAANKAKNASEAKRKTKMILARWLREPETTAEVSGPKFRDPAVQK